MSDNSYFIEYQDTIINLQLLFCNRKTLGITVYPNKSVVVRAPKGKKPEDVILKVKNKAAWIKGKLDSYAQAIVSRTEKKYIEHEIHPFLGKSYRLKIEKGLINSARLVEGYIVITCAGLVTVCKIKSSLEKWYHLQAYNKFHEIIEKCCEQIKLSSQLKPKLILTNVKSFWGSMSTKGVMKLNIQLIKYPEECIEYVVMHELCHIFHHNHGAGFYKLLVEYLPDWKARKHKLRLLAQQHYIS
ncbi:M48 family metallopeptidase [Rickettsiales endosymbiont of Stachyamoeba lipophora]|uniref:M48 family metallopeptidase n=1 Tax=Rickettsiales endosymbiont of Stachyamoeba lipophora TaxID=2486578 RepID=UPI000F651E16|nr:SprT family zinc-dependent metalloprotease [Rickettsiales endosymbiont of Stachyamoeba lipophora]AZL15912.1 M48 family peptidase [Rickettsiales endosymbiont of Stachyamoeba lipophora]